MKNKVLKILGIILLIILLVFIISLSVFYVSHISNKNIDMLEGQYLNDFLTVNIKDNSFVLVVDNVYSDYKIINKKENILMLKQNNKEYYVLIYDNNILYLDWLNEYVFYVK